MNRSVAEYTEVSSRFTAQAIPQEYALEAPPGIGYWMFNFDPKWEAASRELELLATAFAPVYGTRTISINLDKRPTQLFGRDKHLPAFLALAALPLLLRSARAVPINHIFASAGERLLMPRLARLGNTILTITKGSRRLLAVEKNVETLKTLRYVVVESERHYDLLMQLGLPPERVRLIYPGLAPEPFRRAPGPFTVLFATSPKKDYLLTRGINLIVKAAEKLPWARFRLVWRQNPEQARQLIRERGVTNVELVAGYIEDMKSQYDSADAVILPALEPDSLKPCPHSGLHALAHGKPLLASHAASLAGIVERHQCGVVFEPTIDSLCDAVSHLAANYDRYQVNTAHTLEQNFSRNGFIERYGKLYASLLE